MTRYKADLDLKYPRYLHNLLLDIMSSLAHGHMPLSSSLLSHWPACHLRCLSSLPGIQTCPWILFLTYTLPRSLTLTLTLTLAVLVS